MTKKQLDALKGHMPGPWEWRMSATEKVYTDLDSMRNDSDWPVLEAEDYYVCVSDVDARLIAAAPDLLDHIDEQQWKIDRLRESLRWYEKIVGECSRRDHEGVLAKNALVADSGGIAKAALKELDDGLCEECGIHPADSPSKLCAGCDAYKDHQA